MGQVAKESLAHEGYIPVSIATLVAQTSVGIPLYVCPESSAAMQLYRGAEVPLENDDLEALLNRGLTTLYVREQEHGAYQQYLRDNLDSIVADETQPVERRFASLNTVVRDILASAFSTGDPGQTVQQCGQLAQHTVDLICREDVVEKDLLGVMYHDYHTFTHSANVSYYCVMLANALQLGDAAILREISAGALLHDLGKLEIPERILCKPGRLDDSEFAAIRAHPRTGFLKLCHREDLSFAQLMMVYQHHERLDGRGYPVGITAEEIHPWARLCSVVDVFEALTSNRPYRAGLPTRTALEILDRDRGLAFDSEMLQCWMATIQNS